MTRTIRPLLTLSIVAVVVLAACGSSGSSKAGGTSATTVQPTTTTAGGSGGGRYGAPTASTTAPAKAGGVVVNVTTTKLGLTLVDSSGLTLYEYQPDPKGSSTCTGACATAWPPVTVSGTTVTVGKNLPASLFSTVNGPSGSHIVAIAGHALYRFSGDTKPGDTTGEGVGGFHAAGPVGNTM
jgi:predicted lipoprotein with Yx(FWY)xxD motif